MGLRVIPQPKKALTSQEVTNALGYVPAKAVTYYTVAGQFAKHADIVSAPYIAQCIKHESKKTVDLQITTRIEANSATESTDSTARFELFQMDEILSAIGATSFLDNAARGTVTVECASGASAVAAETFGRCGLIFIVTDGNIGRIGRPYLADLSQIGWWPATQDFMQTGHVLVISVFGLKYE